jgi:sugar lactone lactonase YvrE
VAPSGQQTLHIQDVDAEHLAWVEAAYQAGSMDRPHLDGVKSKQLKNISSIAFAGPDLRQAYLGCLLGQSILKISMPVQGVAPTHWNYSAAL